MPARGVTLEEQGFIHCSLRHQLRAVAEFLCSDAGDLVVLVIDTGRLPAPVRYEAPGAVSDDLDDYPDQFRVWPVPDDELADELEVWQCFVQWRGQFDGGARPGPFPGQLRTEAFSRVQERRNLQPPESARAAIPAGRLDRNRSFAGRVPTHRDRWTFP